MANNAWYFDCGCLKAVCVECIIGIVFRNDAIKCPTCNKSFSDYNPAADEINEVLPRLLDWHREPPAASPDLGDFVLFPNRRQSRIDRGAALWDAGRHPHQLVLNRMDLQIDEIEAVFAAQNVVNNVIPQFIVREVSRLYGRAFERVVALVDEDDISEFDGFYSDDQLYDSDESEPDHSSDEDYQPGN